MGDDDETNLHVTYASHLDMDHAFCDRMPMAVAAELESAPIGVITTPRTKSPPTSLGDMLPAPRPFAPPWTIEELDAGVVALMPLPLPLPLPLPSPSP